MNLEQLTGLRLRLNHELAIAYGTAPWNGGRIQRLGDELSAVERQIAQLLAPHEQLHPVHREAA